MFATLYRILHHWRTLTGRSQTLGPCYLRKCSTAGWRRDFKIPVRDCEHGHGLCMGTGNFPASTAIARNFPARTQALRRSRAKWPTVQRHSDLLTCFWCVVSVRRHPGSWYTRWRRTFRAYSLNMMCLTTSLTIFETIIASRGCGYTIYH